MERIIRDNKYLMRAIKMNNLPLVNTFNDVLLGVKDPKSLYFTKDFIEGHLRALTPMRVGFIKLIATALNGVHVLKLFESVNNLVTYMGFSGGVALNVLEIRSMTVYITNILTSSKRVLDKVQIRTPIYKMNKARTNEGLLNISDSRLRALTYSMIYLQAKEFLLIADIETSSLFEDILEKARIKGTCISKAGYPWPVL